jgi:hypothetical protein
MRTNRYSYSGLIFAVALAAAWCGCGTNPVWKHQTFAFEVPAEAPPANSPTNLVSLSRLTISPLFQTRAFTYRTAENTYEQDPYASFLVSPERTLTEAVRGWLHKGGGLGQVIEPGSALVPSVIVEASVSELDGDFRDPAHPLGVMSIHFVIYQVAGEGPNRVLLDKTSIEQTPLAERRPTALMAAWHTDLRKIMEEINTEYVQAHPNDRR